MRLEKKSRHRLRIAHITNIIDDRKNSGSARAAKEIITELSEESRCEQIFIHFSNTSEVKDEIYSLPNTREIIIPYLKLPFASHSISFLVFFLAFRIRFKEKFDVVHWHWIRVYPLFWIIPSLRVFVTVHDANYRLVKSVRSVPSKFFYWNLRLSQNKISLFFADSIDARHKIVKYYKFKEDKVKNVYLATNFDKLTPVKPSNFKIPNRGFFICVSRWQDYKNVSSLVIAYDNLLKDKADIPKLVLVGKPVLGHLNPLTIRRNDLLLESLIVYDDLTDNELAYLYDHAKLNITPSLSEGFGLSVLEGIARGCPSLDHRYTSTSEISGYAGIHVDMNSYSEIEKGINNFLESKNLQRYLRSQSFARNQYFSWQKTASRLFKFYSAKKY